MTLTTAHLLFGAYTVVVFIIGALWQMLGAKFVSKKLDPGSLEWNKREGLMPKPPSKTRTTPQCKYCKAEMYTRHFDSCAWRGQGVSFEETDTAAANSREDAAKARQQRAREKPTCSELPFPHRVPL